MVADLKQHIVQEIQRLSAEHGRPPGRDLFQRETGIAKHEWLGRFWARWGDALVDAGLVPNSLNARKDSAEILQSVAEVALNVGRIPTHNELMLLGQNDPSLPSAKTVQNHFKRDALLAGLRSLAERDDRYSALKEMVPQLPADSERGKPPSKEGWVYLLQSGSHYKIGRSDTIERRVKEISVAQPEATKLVHAIRTDDPTRIEGYWHRRFADRRANGEWFKLSRQDLAAFRKRKFQ